MTNELTTTGGSTYSIMRMDSDKLGELIRTNLGAGGVTPGLLTRVKIPAGGGQTWMVPTLTGETPERELRGIMIHQRDIRIFWPSPEPKSEPPACASDDLFSGSGYGVRWDGDTEGEHACAACRWSKWGSSLKGGKGPACSERKVIFLLREDSLFPLMITLPPTSLDPMKRFLFSLICGEKNFFEAEIAIGLEKKVSAAGQTYSRIAPRFLRDLTPEEETKIATIRDAMIPALSRVRVHDEEMDGSDVAF